MNFIDKAKWIWESDDFVSNNQYVVFKKIFNAKKSDNAKIAISCDSDFKLYLNDKLVGKDQFPDYPQEKTYSIFNLSDFCDGDNVIKIDAFYTGKDTFVYAKGLAGLIAAIKFDDGRFIYSDKSWMSAKNTAFHNGDIEQVTPQLGFVVKYDSTKENNLQFHNAIERENAVGNYIKSLTIRPLPNLINNGKIVTKIVKKSSIYRSNNSGATFADIVKNDEISPANNKANGVVVVGDLSRECVGEFFLNVVASKNTIIDISHGEYLIDNLVCNKIHNRNFTDRYICKDGENSFILPFRRLGARYLQLNITNYDGNIEIKEFGLYETIQDLPKVSKFITNETYSQKLYNTSINTLKSCMHNHYEDCPWREQGLYAYDSRVQMLFNYYTFGNYKFTRESLNLQGMGINRENGYLSLCAPTNYSITIPIFSMVWVCAMYEYYMYSSDITLLEKYKEQLCFMADKYLENKLDNCNLYKVKDDKTLWNFFEWVDGLANTDKLANPNFGSNPKEISLLFNVYLYESLQSLSNIFIALNSDKLAEKYKQIANELRKAIEKTFWDNNKNCYATKIIEGKFDTLYHVHSQSVMLKNKLVPQDKISKVVEAINSNDLINSSISPLYYYLEAMFSIDDIQREKIVSSINKKLLDMIDNGATSFYETEDGYKAFDGAGSLCHAWSCIHSFYYGSKVLGVEPISAGFKDFSLNIYAKEFKEVSGEVPTPHGYIYVSWVKCDDFIETKISYPKNLNMIVLNKNIKIIEEVKY